MQALLCQHRPIPEDPHLRQRPTRTVRLGFLKLHASVTPQHAVTAGIVHRAMGTGEPSERWYGQQAVYRVSMGNFVSSMPRPCNPPA